MRTIRREIASKTDTYQRDKDRMIQNKEILESWLELHEVYAHYQQKRDIAAINEIKKCTQVA